MLKRLQSSHWTQMFTEDPLLKKESCINCHLTFDYWQSIAQRTSGFLPILSDMCSITVENWRVVTQMTYQSSHWSQPIIGDPSSCLPHAGQIQTCAKKTILKSKYRKKPFKKRNRTILRQEHGVLDLDSLGLLLQRYVESQQCESKREKLRLFALWKSRSSL